MHSCGSTPQAVLTQVILIPRTTDGRQGKFDAMMRPNQLTTVLLDVPVTNEKPTGLAQTLGQL